MCSRTTSGKLSSLGNEEGGRLRRPSSGGYNPLEGQGPLPGDGEFASYLVKSERYSFEMTTDARLNGGFSLADPPNSRYTYFPPCQIVYSYQTWRPSRRPSSDSTPLTPESFGTENRIGIAPTQPIPSVSAMGSL